MHCLYAYYLPIHCLQEAEAAAQTAVLVAIGGRLVAALAIGAYALNSPFVWPLYWFLQGTMFWVSCTPCEL